ncbi:MAG: cation:proton antiporter [Candidatus Hydrogenedentota bacterium]
MDLIRWSIGAVLIAGFTALAIFRPFPLDLGPDALHVRFVSAGFYLVILAIFLCLFRVLRGPTPADRLVAIDIFGVLIVGSCAILSVGTGQSWFMDIGIAWALMSFIGALALSKYLEGRPLDD